MAAKCQNYKTNQNSIKYVDARKGMRLYLTLVVTHYQIDHDAGIVLDAEASAVNMVAE